MPTNKRTVFKLNAETLFGLCAVLFLATALVLGKYMGYSATDIKLHDTYFVIAHSHIMLFLALILAEFTSIYYFFPKIFKRSMNTILGNIHALVTCVGLLCIIIPAEYMSERLAPVRRYYSFNAYESFNKFGYLTMLISICAVLVIFVQLLFIYNLFYSMFWGKKITRSV